MVCLISTLITLLVGTLVFTVLAFVSEQIVIYIGAFAIFGFGYGFTAGSGRYVWVFKLSIKILIMAIAGLMVHLTLSSFFVEVTDFFSNIRL